MFIRQAIVKKVLIRTCRVDFFQKRIRFAALFLGRVEYWPVWSVGCRNSVGQSKEISLVSQPSWSRIGL